MNKFKRSYYSLPASVQLLIQGAIVEEPLHGVIFSGRFPDQPSPKDAQDFFKPFENLKKKDAFTADVAAQTKTMPDVSSKVASDHWSKFVRNQIDGIILANKPN